MQARALIGLGAAAIITACGHQGIQKQYSEMRPAMIRGDWETASAQIEKAKDKVYGEKDRVMYWLNLGLIQHYAKKHAPSNENLVKAEQAMEELWTTSISAEASKFAINETMQSYPGEDFEKVLVYYYTSLNNMAQGDLQKAAVEARRADELLKKMQIHFEKEGEGGTIYKQDAFMLWLVGLYYEMEGRSSLNEAFLAYKAAYNAYKQDYAGNFGTPPPPYIGEDLVRVAKLLGFADEAAKFAAETGATGDTAQKLAEMGEVIVLHANGESPSKRELRFDGQMPDGYVMSIAVPQFVEIPPRVRYATIAASGVSANTDLAEPIRSIVLKNFQHREGAIKARALARAVIKYAATKGAQAAAGGDSTGAALIGLVGNVAAAVTEAADLRSWTTLPSEIRVARLWLPPGQHQLTVSYHADSGGQIGRTDTIAVDVQAGKRQVVSIRSVE